MDNNNKYDLNLDDFKKWMKGQEDFASKFSKRFPIGETVISRCSGRKLSETITLDEGNLKRVIKEFLKNGGKVKEFDDYEYIVEVRCGSFSVKKKYVMLD